MSRMHIHIATDSLEQSIRFYSVLFGAEPVVLKPDYAKWSLDNPSVNFAISTRSKTTGLDHIGIQADSDEEQATIEARLKAADIAGLAQQNTACCYARSDKYWVTDPQGIAWETFHSLGSIPTYGGEPDEDRVTDSSCCAPLPGSVSNGCCS